MEPSKTRAVRLTRWPAPSVVTTGGPPFTRDTHRPRPGYSAAVQEAVTLSQGFAPRPPGHGKSSTPPGFSRTHLDDGTQRRLTTTARSPPAAHLTTRGRRPWTASNRGGTHKQKAAVDDRMRSGAGYVPAVPGGRVAGSSGGSIPRTRNGAAKAGKLTE